MQTVPITVTSYELDGITPHLAQPEQSEFPVIVGNFGKLDSFYGDIPKSDESQRIGLRKPAQQHQRSAIVTLDNEPVVITVEGRELLVSAKGTSMSWPRVSPTSNSDQRGYPYTYGLVSADELSNRFEHMATLREVGVPTEHPVGCFQIQEYLFDGQRITREEFAVRAIERHIRIVAAAQLPHREKVKREEAMREYVAKPHVIILRGTEAALRLRDVQDNPQAHTPEMLERVNASGEWNTDEMTLPDYFAWLQDRVGQNLRSMQDAGLVRAGLNNGNKITTNGEIVDLDAIRRREDCGSDVAFDAACRLDISDAADSIKLLQKATGLKPDVSRFMKYFENLKN